MCIHRKVKEETATGTTSSSRVRTTLTLSVQGTEFDTAACTLRVKGRNIEENRFVKASLHGELRLLLCLCLFSVENVSYCTYNIELFICINLRFTIVFLYWCIFLLACDQTK